jgi:geranylgeranyl reductase
MSGAARLGWTGIARIGCVQAAIGAVVVLTTSTLNRVMVVELGFAASVPGALVALHYALQFLRPAWGHRSDRAPWRTPLIVAGMALLAAGGVLAAVATAWAARDRAAGLALAVGAFALIGIGVGAAGTSALALLAERVEPERKPAAGALVWMMMIVGFIASTILVGQMIAPFSFHRLVVAAGVVGGGALVLTLVAVAGLERGPLIVAQLPADLPFAAAFRQVWADRTARRFTWFIALSMLAYGAQDLILEPYAGSVFALTPAETTAITTLQNGGALAGMLLVAMIGRRWARDVAGVKRLTRLGCIGSAAALAAIALAGDGLPALLRPAVACLGLANGVFAASAVALMMGLAAHDGDTGLRLGVWGTAQAVAMGVGNLAGTVAVDAAARIVGPGHAAYGLVFVVEAALFLVTAAIALPDRQAKSTKVEEAGMQDYDVVVIGGGPAGATAAADLAAAGRHVLLLDRAGRIKPCGGAIPPRLIRDFAIPDELLCAHVHSARIIAPSGRTVDMPIDGDGYVGMVDRDRFDEWLRCRAAEAGAERRTGRFAELEQLGDGRVAVSYTTARGAAPETVIARMVIGADGARSEVARQALPGQRTRHVFAYHEIVASPQAGDGVDFVADQCDVIYEGALSPDFYAWVFPHGAQTSIGVGSAHKGFALREAVAALRARTRLDNCATVRGEGAPIPLKPLRRWDNRRNVLVIGDAAGVVAPASGEGIYYAMASARMGAAAVEMALATGRAQALAGARRTFMAEHGKVFRALGLLQGIWYRNDWLRERFVALCRDPDIQRLTWQAYMEKRMVRAERRAHWRIAMVNVTTLMSRWRGAAPVPLKWRRA